MPDIWKEIFKQAGMSVVLLVILYFYYNGETKKWEQMQNKDSLRWEQLFQKYSDDQAQALTTIRECCHMQSQEKR